MADAGNYVIIVTSMQTLYRIELRWTIWKRIQNWEWESAGAAKFIYVGPETGTPPPMNIIIIQWMTLKCNNMHSTIWMSLYADKSSTPYNLQVIGEGSVTGSCKLQLDLWFGGKAVWQHGRPAVFLLHLFKAVFLMLGSSSTPEGGMRCQKKDCEFSCRFVRQLRSHLSKEHSIKMDSETKNFSSEEGPSQHTSSCKPRWRQTHIHTHNANTPRCVCPCVHKCVPAQRENKHRT